MPAEGQNSSSAHWELYHRLKAEGRLNLLFRLSDTAVALLPLPATPAPHSNVLPFISRAQQLAWRHQWRLGRFVRLAWRNGRWCKLSWTPVVPQFRLLTFRFG